MKRSLLVSLIVIAIVTLSASTALAAIGPTADAYVRSTQVNTNYGTDIYLSLYTNGSGCTTQDYFYLKFDLGAVTQEIGHATLTLVTAANPSSVVAGSTKVSLYQVADDSWIESGPGGITFATAPTVGAEILPSVDAPTINGQSIVFGSASASTALSDYLQAEAAGDKVASFAVKLTGTCNPVTTGVRFASKENTTVANRPALELYTPNAVTLSDTSATRTTWPLYAGLAAVALLTVAGVSLSRRRASLR